MSVFHWRLGKSLLGDSDDWFTNESDFFNESVGPAHNELSVIGLYDSFTKWTDLFLELTHWLNDSFAVVNNSQGKINKS